LKVSERIRGFLGLRGNFLPIVVLELVSNVGWSMFEVIWQPYVLSLGATVSILGALLFESFGFHAPILGGLAIILIVIVIMTTLPEQRGTL